LSLQDWHLKKHEDFTSTKRILTITARATKAIILQAKSQSSTITRS